MSLYGFETFIKIEKELNVSYIFTFNNLFYSYKLVL